MGAFKWITGILGWVSGGPIGALLGYFIGSALESGLKSANLLPGGENGSGQAQATGGYGQRGYSRQHSGTSHEQQRNSFMVSLLVLSSAIIRADGRFMQSELNYVREFIRRNFGFQAEDEAMRILDELNRKEINIYAVGAQIAINMNYSQRMQLFHYLADLANIDGNVCQQELDVLNAVASAIRLTSTDAASVLAMFSKSKESAYTVLEIEPSASDEEVKKAYRRLAMKNHPDKVAQLGADVQKAAAAKFQKIQAAYETIKKERGLI